MNSTLGADPGVSGAIALLSLDSSELDVIDTPILEVRGKRIVDRHQLARWIDYRSQHIAHAVIEKVSAMPRQGVTSSFNFGMSYGQLIMCVAASFIPHTLVPPNQWKVALRVPKDKDGARARASELLPQHAHEWRLKKHDGRAEAALMAIYARRLITDETPNPETLL